MEFSGNIRQIRAQIRTNKENKKNIDRYTSMFEPIGELQDPNEIAQAILKHTKNFSFKTFFEYGYKTDQYYDKYSNIIALITITKKNRYNIVSFEDNSQKSQFDKEIASNAKKLNYVLYGGTEYETTDESTDDWVEKEKIDLKNAENGNISIQIERDQVNVYLPKRICFFQKKQLELIAVELDKLLKERNTIVKNKLTEIKGKYRKIDLIISVCEKGKDNNLVEKEIKEYTGISDCEEFIEFIKGLEAYVPQTNLTERDLLRGFDYDFTGDNKNDSDQESIDR